MIATDFLMQKYHDLFDLAKRAIEEGPSFLVGKNANSLERQVTLFHFARAMYLLEGIHVLCTHGLATEAMVLLRSLLNLYINIKWLTNTDVAQRFERFADFEVVFRKLAIQSVIDYGDIWDQIKDDKLSVHDQNFESIKKKYSLLKREDLFNWSGKSIFKMASERGVDLEKDYRIIYGRLSSIEHTGPASVREYLDDSDTGITKIKTGSRDENIDMVLLTALEYYFNVKAIAHNAFDLEWPNLEKDKEAFLTLQRKYWVSKDKEGLTSG
ncbi:MAG: DUF5677 domain-containing protein [Thermodesulfobacteriota bacterium]